MLQGLTNRSLNVCMDTLTQSCTGWKLVSHSHSAFSKTAWASSRFPLKGIIDDIFLWPSLSVVISFYSGLEPPGLLRSSPLCNTRLWSGHCSQLCDESWFSRFFIPSSRWKEHSSPSRRKHMEVQLITEFACLDVSGTVAKMRVWNMRSNEAVKKVLACIYIYIYGLTE